MNWQENPEGNLFVTAESHSMGNNLYVSLNRPLPQPVPHLRGYQQTKGQNLGTELLRASGINLNILWFLAGQISVWTITGKNDMEL